MNVNDNCDSGNNDDGNKARKRDKNKRKKHRDLLTNISAANKRVLETFSFKILCESKC